MLFLLFQIGETRYALETAAVLEIVPRVALRPVPGAPVGVAGLLDYHGSPVPVLDLCEMATGHLAQKRFSTRLILARVPAFRDEAEGGRVVGLLAERATTLLQRQPSDFARTGLQTAGNSFLGPVTTDGEGFIHRLNLETLLSGPVGSLLAPLPEAALP